MIITPDTKLKKPTPVLYKGMEAKVFHHDKGKGSCVIDLLSGETVIADVADLELIGKTKTAIPKESKGRSVENKQYLALRKIYLENHEVCEANVKGCTRKATQVHHAAGRIGKRLIDVSTFVPLCGNCHTWVENNAEQAKEMGLSVNRL